jgi:hypothetical protein
MLLKVLHALALHSTPCTPTPYTCSPATMPCTPTHAYRAHEGTGAAMASPEELNPKQLKPIPRATKPYTLSPSN